MKPRLWIRGARKVTKFVFTGKLLLSWNVNLGIQDLPMIIFFQPWQWAPGFPAKLWPWTSRFFWLLILTSPAKMLPWIPTSPTLHWDSRISTVFMAKNITFDLDNGHKIGLEKKKDFSGTVKARRTCSFHQGIVQNFEPDVKTLNLPLKLRIRQDVYPLRNYSRIFRFRTTNPEIYIFYSAILRVRFVSVLASNEILACCAIFSWIAEKPEFGFDMWIRPVLQFFVNYWKTLSMVFVN